MSRWRDAEGAEGARRARSEATAGLARGVETVLPVPVPHSGPHPPPQHTIKTGKPNSQSFRIYGWKILVRTWLHPPVHFCCVVLPSPVW